MLAHLGDPTVPDLEDHHVVVLVGLAALRRRPDRHLDVDELVAGEVRRPLDLHRSGRVVEPDPAGHQRKHGAPPFVVAAERPGLGCEPACILGKQLGDPGIALLHELEITIDEREIVPCQRGGRRSTHRVTIASRSNSKGPCLLRAPLLHFLALGALLFALQTGFAGEPDARPIEVPRSEVEERIEAFALQIGRPADAEEARALEDQAIEDALWLDQAFAIGLPEIDAVVHQRLVQNMRFLDPETTETDEALYARAVELGMERSDTVVRRRLIDRIQAVVRARVRGEPVDEGALRKYFDRNAERWREPTLVDLTHVYLSRDKRGERAAADARSIRARLDRESTAPDAAVALGDPFLGGHTLRGATPNRIAARLGPGFAAALVDAEPGRWLGPIESAFGPHLVWIERRITSRIPPFEEVRSRVLDDWLENRTREALREEATRLRAGVEIRWIEDRGTTRDEERDATPGDASGAKAPG